MDAQQHIPDDADDALLSRYFDGELSHDEREVVRARLASEPLLRRKLAALEQLHGAFDVLGETSQDGVQWDAVFAKVKDGVRKDRASGFGEGLRVYTTELVEHRRKVLVPALGVFAMAAAVLLAVFATDVVPHGKPLASNDGAGLEQSKKVPFPGEKPGDEVPAGSSVVDPNCPEGVRCTVFDLSADGAPVGVLWLSDEGT